MSLKLREIIFIVIDVLGILLLIVLFLPLLRRSNTTTIILVTGVVATYLSISGWLWQSIRALGKDPVEEILEKHGLLVKIMPHMEAPIFGYNLTFCVV